MTRPWPDPPAPDAIRERRESAGLTQTAAAALIYRSRNAWQQWEAGKRQMDPALWEYWLIRAAGAA